MVAAFLLLGIKYNFDDRPQSFLPAGHILQVLTSYKYNPLLQKSTDSAMSATPPLTPMFLI